MSSDTTFQTVTKSSEETLALGFKIANLLRGGETIELVGDLGAGKTTLAQGIVHALGYDGEVTSPTFTLSRDYQVRNGLTVHHFDFYRLSGHDVVSDELNEFINDSKSINLIEWADHGAAKLPSNRIRIELKYGEVETAREINVRSNTKEIIEGLKNVSGD